MHFLLPKFEDIGKANIHSYWYCIARVLLWAQYWKSIPFIF